MRVLIIKLSSLGDVIHTLPALTDAKKNHPEIIFDWVVEPAFSEIPLMHSAVNKVIPLSLRLIKKRPFYFIFSGYLLKSLRAIRAEQYNYIIDAQGLIKSSLVGLFSRGPKYGMNKQSARETFAALGYNNSFFIDKKHHAVDRTRELFSKILNYKLDNLKLDYGIEILDNLGINLNNNILEKKYLLFFHGTTWQTKHWPESYWKALIQKTVEAGFDVVLTWGNSIEQERAARLANITPYSNKIHVLPKLNLNKLALWIANAQAVVTVDTGLAHLSAALNKPTLSIYGPTDPEKTGTMGDNQVHIRMNFDCAPCFRRKCIYDIADFGNAPPCYQTKPPQLIWDALMEIMVTR